jgi:hypothetical protein
LVLTDVATGWTEYAPLLFREPTLLNELLKELGKLIPFAVRGFDSDNDSMFVKGDRAGLLPSERHHVHTCRPYRKNDQAWVEQKTGAVVRRIVGYRRFEGTEAAAALAQLYGTARLFVNFFQQSFKLAAKARDGARIKKFYHPPATPCQRLLADPRTPAAVRQRVQALRVNLDPVQLLSQMRPAQQRLVDIADRPIVSHAVAAVNQLAAACEGSRDKSHGRDQAEGRHVSCARSSLFFRPFLDPTGRIEKTFCTARYARARRSDRR